VIFELVGRGGILRRSIIADSVALFSKVALGACESVSRVRFPVVDTSVDGDGDSMMMEGNATSQRAVSEPTG